jgi:tetratricopeptide (TPR) repeat protein
MGKSMVIVLATAAVLAVVAAGGLFLGLYYANQGKPDPAEEARQNAERGAALLKEQKYDEAIKCLTAAIRYDQRDPATLHNRGLAYAGKGDYERAIDDYNNAIRLKPNEAEYFTHRAEAYRATQQYDKALIDFTQALKEDDDYVPAFRGRGAVYLAQKKYKEAAQEYREALKRDEHDPVTLTELARAEYHLDDLAGARAHLDAALDLDSNYAPAYMLRGLVYAAQRDYDRALANFNEKIRLADDAEARYRRGEAHLQKGDKGKAFDDFAAAIRLDKGHGPARVARGKLHVEAKKYKEAVADFSVALASVPTEDLFYRRGLAYLETGEYSEAVGDFTKALEMNPRSSETPERPATAEEARRAAAEYDQRALAHLRARSLDKAQLDADQAVELAPKNLLCPSDRAALVTYLYNRAAILIKQQVRELHKRAEKDLDAALTLDPANIRAINTLGELHFSQQEYEKAVEDYDRAIALNEKDAPSWNHRGLAYQNQYDFQQALADFKKAIELDPNYAEALNNCAWLMATCQNRKLYVELHDQAEALARKAVDVDGRKTARYMSTLAAACAARLKFEEARKWEESARDKTLPNSYNPEEMVKSQKRLEHYGKNLPWIDTPDAYN